MSLTVPPKLRALTDIDWTTAGAGKVLTQTPSSGLPYSLQTPGGGGGGLEFGPHVKSILDPAFGSTTGTGSDDTAAFFAAIAWLNGGPQRTLIIVPPPVSYIFGDIASGPLVVSGQADQTIVGFGDSSTIDMVSPNHGEFLHAEGDHLTLRGLSVISNDAYGVAPTAAAITITSGGGTGISLEDISTNGDGAAIFVEAPGACDRLRIRNISGRSVRTSPAPTCLALAGFSNGTFLDNLILEVTNGTCFALTDATDGEGYLRVSNIYCQVQSSAPGAVGIQFAADNWYMIELSNLLLNNESDGSATAFQFLKGVDQASIVNASATGFSIGIDMSDPGLSFLTNVLFDNCQFTNCAQYALRCATANAVFSVSLNHCLLRIKSPATAAVLVDSTATSGGLNSSSNKLTMSDTVLEATGDNSACLAITATNTTQITMVDDRLFTDVGTGRVGYSIDGSGANLNMQPITIRGGSVASETGIAILSPTAFVAPVTIEDVDCSGSTTPITFASAVETYGPTLIIRNCKGINPYGALTGQPAVAATTVAVANPYPFDCIVYVTANALTVGLTIATSGSAGTGSSIPVLLGTTVSVPVRAGGQTITLTYTGTAPTWKWVGL
jgi:hypothetical protein